MTVTEDGNALILKNGEKTAYLRKDEILSLLKSQEPVEGKKDVVKDNVNPEHYKQGKVECIDALEAATVNKDGYEGSLVFNIIKYLWRYESKNGLEDVKKAAWYLNRLQTYLENK